MKIDSLEQFYDFLETFEDYGEDSFFLDQFSEFRDDCEKRGEIESAEKIQLELLISKFHILKSELRGNFQFKDHTGRLIESPHCSLFTKNDIEYIKNRITVTKLPPLKARYAHIVWQSQWKHLDYLMIAIENYLSSAELLEKRDEQEPDKFFGLRITSMIKTAIYLAQTAKLEDTLKNRIKEEVRRLVFTFNFESSSFFALRADLIETSLESRKFFGKEFFTGMDEECERVSEKLKLDGNPEAQIVILDIGAKVSRLLDNGKYIYFIERIALLYQEKAEKYADHSEYLNALHFAELAAAKYKEIKYQEEIDSVTEKIIDWKKKLDFKKIETSVPPDDEYEKQTNDLLDNFSKLSGEDLLLALTFSSVLIPESEKMVKIAKSISSERSFSDLIPIEIRDHYGNVAQRFETENEIGNYNNLNIYNIALKYIKLPIIRNIVFTAMYEERLTLNHLIDYFSKYAWFAKPYERNINGTVIEVNWLSLIFPSLKEFFLKVEEMIQTKKGTDFILAVDSLTLKLEGIIRNLCEILGIKVFKEVRDKSDQGKERTIQQQADINMLLKEPKLREQITADDISFFEFLLIEKKGYNLRNRVAHSLLFFQEYGFDLMVLLLMALLRLSGYEINNEEGDAI